MLEPITATLVRTREDYLVAFAARDAKQHRTLRRFTAVLTLLVGGLVAALWPVPPGFWMLGVPALVVGVLLLPASTRLQANQGFGAIPEGIRELSLTLTETTMRWHNDRYERTQPWSMVREWIETAELIVVLDRNGGLDVWRKDAFDEDDLRELRGMLDASIPLEAEKSHAVASKPRRSWARTIRIVVIVAVFVTLYVLWRGMS